MLMQTFLSAKELGIDERLHESLIKVLGMLERGEIKPKCFTMRLPEWSLYNEPTCSTPCCILGWARVVGKKRYLGIDHQLFYPSDGNSVGYEANPTQAARVLRHYLATGEVTWAAVMKETANDVA